jgi:hypothetical protein
VPFHSAFTDDSPTVAPAEDVQAQIKGLIEKLGSEDYETREAAAEELTKIGMPALDALAEATRSTDAEVAFRAEQILDTLLGGLTMDEFKDARQLMDQLRAATTLDAAAKLQQALYNYMPGIVTPLESLLGDANPIAQLIACRILAEVQDEKALQKIDFFLAEYEQYYDAGNLDAKDKWKSDVLKQAIGLLCNYPRQRATTVAEKYLRKPYIDIGIFAYGTWTEKRYDTFAAFARDGMLGNSYVSEYFIQIKDTRIVPFLKEQLAQEKDVESALRILGAVAPEDPETKQWCMKFVDNEKYFTTAVHTLLLFDRADAVKIMMAKLDSYIKAAENGEETPVNVVSSMLYSLRQIKEQESYELSRKQEQQRQVAQQGQPPQQQQDEGPTIDDKDYIALLKRAALTEQLQETALREIRSLQQKQRIQVLAELSQEWKGDPCKLLLALAETTAGAAAVYLDSAYPSRTGKDADYVKCLRIMADFEGKDATAYLLTKIPEIENTEAQLRMLSLIAMTRKAEMLPEIEKAFAGFEERHRKFLEEARKASGDADSAALETALAGDMFRLNFFLNMLGKDNSADLRAYVLKCDFVIPSMYIPSVNTWGIPGYSAGPAEMLLKFLKEDTDGLLHQHMREIVTDVLGREYLFDSELETPKDAPPLPGATNKYNPYGQELWLQLLAILLQVGDKEVQKEAASVLGKHASHPTALLVNLAVRLQSYERPAVVKLMRAYCQRIVDSQAKEDPMWNQMWNLANSLTPISVGREDFDPRMLRSDMRYSRYRRMNSLKGAKLILEQLIQ